MFEIQGRFLLWDAVKCGKKKGKLEFFPVCSNCEGGKSQISPAVQSLGKLQFNWVNWN